MWEAVAQWDNARYKFIAGTTKILLVLELSLNAVIFSQYCPLIFIQPFCRHQTTLSHHTLIIIIDRIRLSSEELQPMRYSNNKQRPITNSDLHPIPLGGWLTILLPLANGFGCNHSQCQDNWDEAFWWWKSSLYCELSFIVLTYCHMFVYHWNK